MFADLLVRLVPFRALGLAMCFIMLCAALWAQTARLSTATAALSAQHAKQALMAHLIASQNDGIAALQADTAAREKASAAALTAANKKLSHAQRRLAARPPAPADCPAAVDWLIDRARARAAAPSAGVTQ